jgi:NADH dehydrogenase (ubiquinone) 1 alpha subcomplex subunit 13
LLIPLLDFFCALLLLLLLFLQIDVFKQARPRGPSGLTIWAVSTGLIMFGFVRLGAGNTERNGEKLLERQARFAMAPILQAEQDAKYLARQAEILQREAEIMKDVPGWKVGESVYYNTKTRWVPDNTNHLSKHQRT